MFLIIHTVKNPEKNHNSGDEHYICNKCQKTFTNMEDFKIHEKTSCLELVSSFSYGDHFMSSFFPEISKNILEAIGSPTVSNNIERN